MDPHVHSQVDPRLLQYSHRHHGFTGRMYAITHAAASRIFRAYWHHRTSLPTILAHFNDKFPRDASAPDLAKTLSSTSDFDIEHVATVPPRRALPSHEIHGPMRFYGIRT